MSRQNVALPLRLYVLLLIGIVGVFAAVSTNWRIVHDSPLLLYVGYLLDLGRVPYADVFDMNPPGTFFLNWLCYRIIGDSDLGFRVIESITLTLIALAAWLYLRPISRVAAWVAPLLFALQHLSQGAMYAFQRELVCTVPLAFALVVAFRTPHWSLLRRVVGIGLLTGFIATIKPQLVAPMPILFFGALVWEAEARPSTLFKPKFFLLPSIACLLSVGLIPSLTLVMLAQLGGLDAFLDMVLDYWPLYSQLDGGATIVSSVGRILALLGALNQLSDFIFLGVAAIGLSLSAVAVLRASNRMQIEFVTLALMGGTLILVVVVAAKLWLYHFIPIWYWMSLIAGLAVVSRSDDTSSTLLARIAVILLFTVHALPLPPGIGSFIRWDVPVIKDGDVDEIADFLRSQLRPGDVVQPLDVTGGAIHGMFLARANLATPFIYDFHFYHHPDDPYIQKMRDRLTTGMEASCARFVIEFNDPWRPTGPGTAESFPALEEILAEYTAVLRSDNYRILERNPGCVRSDTAG